MIDTRWLLHVCLCMTATLLSMETRAADSVDVKELVRLTCDAVRFPTYAGNKKALQDQSIWIEKVGRSLGLEVRHAGPVTEIDLKGPAGAPVLGLVVHGDVVPAEPSDWRFPPFACTVVRGSLRGRGSSDDKGALAEALVAMSALKRSGRPLTHTVRLLVGSDEESTGQDMAVYLRDHAPPDYSLVLDLNFPVVVGEKAWNVLTLKTGLTERQASETGFTVIDLNAGLDPAIVPNRAVITLGVVGSARPNWRLLKQKLRSRAVDRGTRMEIVPTGSELKIYIKGKAAHGGANIENGRNALVSLARLMDGLLTPGGADDLLAFARLAGQDVYGTGLGLTENYGIWGRYSVNVATIEKDSQPIPEYALTIVARRTPPLTGTELRERLYRAVGEFNTRTGAGLKASGDFVDDPLILDPQGKLVKRLYSAYVRVTGKEDAPVISGASSYAKRLPNSVPFGIWFPGKPVPWHDVDEQIAVADLKRGAAVLTEALSDLACGPRLSEPLKP
jgi:predicted dipeptidase